MTPESEAILHKGVSVAGFIGGTTLLLWIVSVHLRIQDGRIYVMYFSDPWHNYALLLGILGIIGCLAALGFIINQDRTTVIAGIEKTRAEKEYNAYRPDIIPPYDAHVEILQTYRGDLPTKMRNEIALRLSLSLKMYEISHFVFDARGNPTLEKVRIARKETVETALQMLHYLDGVTPALHDEGPFQISLLDSINNFGYVLGQLIDPLWRVTSPGLFADWRERIAANRAAASTQLLKREELLEGITVDPKDHPGTPKQIVRAYLTGTPFMRLFDG